MMKLISIAINRPMPLPERKPTTRYTIVALYIPPPEQGDPDDMNRAYYSHHHFDDMAGLLFWIERNPLGSPLTTVH